MEFESKRDLDCVWEGAPWHISKNAVILEVFEDHMQSSELNFDKLPVWVRVVNLPYNLRNDKRGLAIAQQIDKHASIVQIDPVGGFLRARVTIDVLKPLRRWIVIESTKKDKVDCYDIEYEQIPHFYFSCSRLGHSDLFCPTPGTRDANGDLPFKASLRAPDEWKRNFSGENSSKEKQDTQNSTKESRSSSSKQHRGVEVTSPVKNPTLNKRKGGPQTQVYRQVVPAPLAITEKGEVAMAPEGGRDPSSAAHIENLGDVFVEKVPKKKKPTPPSSESSAASASQRCQSQ